MSKCIFCGNKPRSKTKEHILPQWLIKMTGDPNREVNFSSGHKFSFNNFTFPSCDLCNNNFSTQESLVKKIIEKILDNQDCSAQEYTNLLDWLDKVRIGLWLGLMTLNKNKLGIKPNFYINQRIRNADRMLGVYTFNTKQKGLNFFGADSKCFMLAPICFGLKINGILLLNISSFFMFSIRCGFPGFKNIKLCTDEINANKTEFSDNVYTQKIKHPIFSKLIHKPSIDLYQPILSKENDKFICNYVNDSFLSKNTYDFEKGIGKIFQQKNNCVEVKENIHDIIKLQEPIKGSYLYQIVRMIYQIQIDYIQEVMPDTGSKECIDVIKLCIGNTKKRMNMLTSKIHKFEEENMSVSLIEYKNKILGGLPNYINERRNTKVENALENAFAFFCKELEKVDGKTSDTDKNLSVVFP